MKRPGRPFKVVPFRRRRMKMLPVALTLLLLATVAESARIAVMYPVGSKSHLLAIKPAVQLLAERGHNVTVFTPFHGLARDIENAREVHLEDIERVIDADLHIDWFAMQSMGKFAYFQMMCHATATMAKSARLVLRNQVFRRLIAERDVDVFLVDAYSNEFVYPIAVSINVPIVTHLSSSPLPMLLGAFGAPLDYASVPSPFTDFTDEMGFLERLRNALVSEFVHAVRRHLMFRKLDAVVGSEFPEAMAIAEAEKRVSLMIVNSHAATTFPRSLPPNVVPIGALHTRSARNLPHDLKDFVDGACDGFVVFSLGSFVPMSSMPNETFGTFASVFSRIGQRVVWKWETGAPAGVPDNVYMTDWIPQQDLLGHRNARLFITHGGLLGTQEAIYHGVPILGLPFGNDQRGNLVKPRRDGYALQLEWRQLDEKTLFDAVTHLLTDARVRESARKASRLVRDEPVAGKELAAYWIEHVLRHGGAEHLQLASRHLAFYKRYLLDVAAFLLAVCLVCSYLAYRSVCLLATKCRNPLLRRKIKVD